MRRWAPIAIAILALATWALWPKASQSVPLTLQFSPDHDLVVTYTLDGNYHDQPATGKAKDSSWRSTGIVRGKAHATNSGAVYRCHFDDFQLYNSQDWLIIGFTREPSGALRYRTDERFPPKQRLANFQTFHIDLNDSEAIDDYSLLQEEWELAVTSDAKIQRLSFSERLRHALVAATKRLRGGPMIEEVINRSDRFPALLGKTPDPIWRTKGQLLQDLDLVHRIVEQQPRRLKIESRSVATAKSRGGWLGMHGRELAANDCLLRWDFDPIDHSIDSIEAHWRLGVATRYMNLADELGWQVHFKAQLSYEQASSAVSHWEQR